MDCAAGIFKKRVCRRFNKMRKDFSVKNYFVYAFRYWLVLVICAVVGLAAGMCYGILSKDKEEISYEGNIAVGGFATFFGDMANVSEGDVQRYNRTREDALNAMQSEQLKADLYRTIEKEWQDLSKLSGKKAQVAFYDAFSVRISGFYMYASFAQKKDGEANNAFSARVVDAYLTLAYEEARARIRSHMGGTASEDGALVVTQAQHKLPKTEDMGVGIMKSCAVGMALGFFAGFAAMLIMYAVDRRITSYGDIAVPTGQKLLGVEKTRVSNKVCPAIDCEMNEKNTLLVCGDEETSRRLSEVYATYARRAGHTTLLIDFSAGKQSDSFGDYLRGKALGECMADEGGIAVLYGDQSWPLMLKAEKPLEALKKTYGRIVICAPYYGDGALGVLCKISDKVVFAVNQSKTKTKDVYFMAQEMQYTDKAIGAAIDNAGKSFVGDSTYMATVDEEE